MNQALSLNLIPKTFRNFSHLPWWLASVLIAYPLPWCYSQQFHRFRLYFWSPGFVTPSPLPEGLLCSSLVPWSHGTKNTPHLWDSNSEPFLPSCSLVVLKPVPFLGPAILPTFLIQTLLITNLSDTFSASSPEFLAILIFQKYNENWVVGLLTLWQ